MMKALCVHTVEHIPWTEQPLMSIANIKNSLQGITNIHNNY